MLHDLKFMGLNVFSELIIQTKSKSINLELFPKQKNNSIKSILIGIPRLLILPPIYIYI